LFAGPRWSRLEPVKMDFESIFSKSLFIAVWIWVRVITKFLFIQKSKDFKPGSGNRFENQEKESDFL
jgi:hypothetical protein